MLLEYVWMEEFKILRISNTSIEILLFSKFYVWVKKIKIMKVKKKWMKKKEDMINVLLICVSLSSHSIDVPRAQTVFLEKDYKKRISISYLLEGN